MTSSTGAPSGIPLESQQRLARALASVGAFARNVLVLLSQPELDCPDLRVLGFAAVRTHLDVQEIARQPWETHGRACVLVVSCGPDAAAAFDVCATLDQVPGVAPILVLLLAPCGENGITADGEMHQTCRILLSVGADDVIVLYGDEVLTCYRLKEAILRTRAMAEKTAMLTENEVTTEKERMANYMKMAWKRFIWDLPGNVLEGIPRVDQLLKERVDGDVGVGEYSFVGRMDSGQFGAVFKATHPEHGIVGVKVMSKASVTSVPQLRAIDSELTIQLNLVPHPNVIAGKVAMQTSSNIILVTDYIGDMHLHSYTTKRLKESGEATLPPGVVVQFCKQEAAAVAHLHACLICHRDLKPTSFMVSNDGATLRLADFGLAQKLCGPGQRVLGAWGSPPFAAPEALVDQEGREGRQEEGYDGLAADVWSLGVNFIELSAGLYSVERLLGWVPSHPVDPGQRRADLCQLLDKWAEVPELQVGGLHSLISSLIHTHPQQRWSITQVVGPHGLDLDGLHRQLS